MTEDTVRHRPDINLLILVSCAVAASACSGPRTSDPIPGAGDVLVGIAADALQEHYACDPFQHRPGELNARDPQCKDDIRKSVQRELDDAGRQERHLESAQFREAFDLAVGGTATHK